MDTNGSFYSLGSAYGTVDDGLGRVPVTDLSPNLAESSFYQNGTDYVEASPVLAGASASAAAASASAAAASVASIPGLLSTYALKTYVDTQDAAEVTARSAPVTAEASARSTADTALTTSVTAEASTRAAADTTLTTAVTAEASARAAADTALTTAFAAADTALSTTLTTAYTAADTALSGTLTTAIGLKAPLASPALTGTPTAPTATVGTNTTQLATTAFVLANAGGVAPTENILINGDFRVNQAAYVSAATLAAGSYGHDQWKAGASGGDYSFTQLKSSTQITIASGKSLIQPVEDASVVGGSYVLSWTGTAQARAGVNTLTPSGSYASSPLLITGQTAGTVMSVEFNTGTLGTVKLSLGTTATPFVMRRFDQEFAACLRYAEAVDLSGTGIGYDNIAFGLADTSTTTMFVRNFAKKRVFPSLLISAAGDFVVTNGAGSVIVCTALTGTLMNSTSIHIQGTVASGLTAGQGSLLARNGTNAAKMMIDSRL